MTPELLEDRRQGNRQSDHDLLIELRGDVKAIREQMERDDDTTRKTLSDHESRLRKSEAMIRYGIGGLSILQFIIMAYIAMHYH